MNPLLKQDTFNSIMAQNFFKSRSIKDEKYQNELQRGLIKTESNFESINSFVLSSRKVSNDNLNSDHNFKEVFDISFNQLMKQQSSRKKSSTIHKKSDPSNKTPRFA